MRRQFSEEYGFLSENLLINIFICFRLLKYNLIKLAIFSLEVKHKTNIDTNFNAFDSCLMKQKLIS